MNLFTKWGEELDRQCPLSEYPRPQLVREHWQCLNGVWQFHIADGEDIPCQFESEILVPFSPETVLSGVERQLLPSQSAWYRRIARFDMPKEGQRLLLHFDAVDQECTVFINGAQVAQHSGGYWGFTVDITDYIVSGDNAISLKVTDASDTGDEAYGKQKLNRGGIWYTSQSGIWQTVWCELVPTTYIESLKITPNYDNGTVHFKINSRRLQNGVVTVYDGDTEVCVGNIKMDEATLAIPSFKSWTPQNPFLYNVLISYGHDTVQTYFGMRSFTRMQGKNGKQCLALNGEPIYHNGLLDQGYWSDGMYTPPSDAAMIYDIETIKGMGFNMLRKHIKIEPLRWYYHCDRLGVLVWQDFVSGGGPYSKLYTQYAPFAGIHFNDTKYKAFGRASAKGRENYNRDMHRTIDLLYNTVSLALWVPFNEGWGQFDAAIIAHDIAKADPTRLIDHASGYHDQGKGDLHSYHVYYKRFSYKKDKHERALALTEFGGFSIAEKGHLTSTKLFGYKIFKSKEKLHKALRRLFRRDVIRHIKKGLCATVYTQVSDVEDEINGVFTYDRKVIKLDVSVIRELNNDIYNEFENNY